MIFDIISFFCIYFNKKYISIFKMMNNCLSFLNYTYVKNVCIGIEAIKS
jgi:hypothetical protein